MASKKVNIGAKPTPPLNPTGIEEWVASRQSNSSSLPEAPPEKIKRLTLDIPESLHRAIKAKAALEGVAMVDMLRDLLQKHYNDDHRNDDLQK